MVELGITELPTCDDSNTSLEKATNAIYYMSYLAMSENKEARDYRVKYFCEDDSRYNCLSLFIILCMSRY